jgi:hypothetical protein
MKKAKLFTIDAPGKQTLEDGSLTHYDINNFLNTNNINPKDISAEYNELSGKLLISIGYAENKSLFKRFVDFLMGRTQYEIRFENLTDYSEKSHTVYIQKALEDAINYSKHETISHGIFVQEGIAKVVFLEYK